MMTNKWDSRFLGLAEHVATWSKDPSTQVGAVIVDDKHRIISLGFNGFAAGVDDSDERLNNKEVKYDLVIHAELNSILFANRDLTGCTLYTFPLSPCVRCAAHIIQSGIKRVVSPITTNTRWLDSCLKAKSMMTEAGLTVEWV